MIDLAKINGVMMDDYEFEERAAIMEFDGGLTRKQAEIEATKLFASKMPQDTFDGINRLGKMIHLQHYASKMRTLNV